MDIKCKKCHTPLPEGALFCFKCGARQKTEQKPKSRGNGQGSVYQLKNKTWIAIITTGYEVDEAGNYHRHTRSKSGFKTKKEAVAYLSELAASPNKQKSITLKELYEKWYPTHRAGLSTMGNYQAAFNYFAPIQHLKLDDIDIDDLQECIDDCPRGKRTRQNMKAVCGLLYKYAIPRRFTTLNLAQYLIVGGGEDESKAALPFEAVETLQSLIGVVPYADYIVAQCYLGFRPAELLALEVKDYNPQSRSFVGGAKTEAGRNRIVPVSKKIQPIIDNLIQRKAEGAVFCNAAGEHMTVPVYRHAFYNALKAAGINNPVVEKDGVKRKTYTPHSCRHTFATMMKQVSAPDKDKLTLIGHTSTEMLRHYQDVDTESLRRIVDAF